MFRRPLTSLYIVVFSLAALGVSGQVGGNYTYAFLNLSPAARPSGLAQATLASVGRDIQFTWLNPALLNSDHRRQIGFSYVNVPGGVGSAEASYGFGYGDKHNIMVGFRYLDFGNFVGTDIAGNPTGDFRASDQLLNGSYSYRLDSNWQFGGSFKLINSVYESYNSFGTAIDLAAIYQIPESRFAFAFIAKNIGVQLVTYAGQREPLPFEMQFAVSNQFEHLPFRWTVQLENLQQWDLTYFDPNAVTRDPITGEETYDDLNFGEKLLRHVSVSGDLDFKSFNAQLGYSFRARGEMTIPSRRTSAGLTYGLGIKLYKFRINYSRKYVHVAGRMHHIGVTVNLDEFGSE